MVYYDHEPQMVLYMPQLDGSANVRIRHDIKEVTDENGTHWEAEEVFFNTFQTESEVTENAATLFFTKSGIAEKLTAVVQDFMDKKAQTKEYDNIASACSYANSTDETFHAEGLACVAWRDACWRKCYEIQAQVIAGTRSIPTAEELIAELPELTW